MMSPKSDKITRDTPILRMFIVSLFLLVIAIVRNQDIFNYAAIALAGICALSYLNFKKNKRNIELWLCRSTFVLATVCLLVYLMGI